MLFTQLILRVRQENVRVDLQRKISTGICSKIKPAIAAAVHRTQPDAGPMLRAALRIPSPGCVGVVGRRITISLLLFHATFHASRRRGQRTYRVLPTGGSQA